MLSRDTYEIWAIDFIDGNLSQEQEKTFLQFLKDHPDLKKELDGLEDIRLNLETISFEGKDDLYRSEFQDREHFEYTSIAFLENELNDEERKDFELFLSTHPKEQVELKYFNYTILSADYSLVFPDKNTLYKNPGITWAPYLIAASLIGLIISIGLYRYEKENYEDYAWNGVTAIDPLTLNDGYPQIILSNLRSDIISYQLPEKTSASESKVKRVIGKCERVNDHLLPLEKRKLALLQSNAKEVQLINLYHSTSDDKNYIAFRDYINQKSKETLATLGGKSINAIENITDKKVALERDGSGKVRKFSLNTKYLAVSFPIGRNR